MGRWKQYRSRGRGVEEAPAFDQVPPTAEQWHTTSADSLLGIEMLTACVAGADGFFARYRVDGDPDWIDWAGQIDCGGSDTRGPFSNGTNYEVQVRWEVDGTTPISDWSDSQFQVIGV